MVDRAGAGFAGRHFTTLAALVLLAGLVVRGSGICDRGLLLFDEAIYMCQARFLAGAVRSIPLALRHGWVTHVRGQEPMSEERVALRERMEAAVDRGLYTWYPKETHCLLIALFSFVFGDTDWVGHAEGLVFGVLTLVLVLGLARSMYGARGALLAALVLALCPLHVMLSRRSLAEADGIFFLVAAVALARAAISGRPAPFRLLFVSGLSVGLSFTCNYRNVISPLILWSLVAAVAPAPNQPLAGARLRGFVWLSVGMVLPLLAWETLYVASFWLLDVPRSSQATYFELLLRAGTSLGAGKLGVGDLGTVPLFLQEYVGLPVLTLATAGLFLVVLTRRVEVAYLALPLAWGIAFVELRTQEQCLRYLGPLAPFLALAAGAVAGDVACVSRLGRLARAALPSVAAVAVLLHAAMDPHEWLSDRSGARATFAWLRERRESGECVRYFCPDNALAWYYDPPAHRWADFVPKNVENLRRRYEMGTRYIVLTPTVLTHYGMPDFFWPLIQVLGQRSLPREFEHPAGGLRYFAYELHQFGRVKTLEDTRLAAELLAREGTRIRVYDLRELLH
ncbi:MAG: glycosyltransferase family 39 protein [Planctomycetes bacterium]|nr:glycosyltransferase family 39 protein [Planctomycetota bacterium]